MLIRKADVSEALAIQNLHIDTVRRINSRDYSEEQIEAWIGNKEIERTKRNILSGFITVCTSEAGDVLGFAARAGKEVHGLYVSADHQGEHVGTELLKRIEDDARLEGIEEMIFHSTLTALQFYLKRGYKEIRREDFPLGKGQKLESVLLSKYL